MKIQDLRKYVLCFIECKTTDT